MSFFYNDLTGEFEEFETLTHVTPITAVQPPAPEMQRQAAVEAVNEVLARAPARNTPSANAQSKPEHKVDSNLKFDFIEAVAEDTKLTPAAFRAAVFIMGHYNHHKGYAFPSTETLAKRMGKGRGTVSEAVQLLAARGWFTIETTRRGNRQGSNRYRPCLEKIGLSVGKNRRSDDFQRRVSDDLSVGFSGVSASGKPDSNPIREPSKSNPVRESPSKESLTSKESSCYALTRDGRSSSLNGKVEAVEDPVRSREIAIELQPNWTPPEAAIEAAIARGCTKEQIAASDAEWRKRNAGQKRTMPEWDRTYQAWMERERPKPVTRSRAATSERFPLPASFRFPDEAIASARGRGLEASTIENALTAFRATAGDDCCTAETWNKRGAGYLAKKQEKLDGDVMVDIGNIMTGGCMVKLSQVKPGQPYTDAKGVRHTKPGKPRPAL